MHYTKLVSILTLALAAVAAPTTEEVEKRQTVDTSTHCGDWDVVTAGPYSLLLDQWGRNGDTTSKDCASITSLSGTTVAWKNTWTWTGGNSVRSYTNMQLNSGIGKQLSAIKSIQSTWRWSQTTSGRVVSNVAYDLFTANSPTGNNINEIMIWLANFNAGPISSAYNSDGTPRPAKSNVSIAGVTWNVYSGSNGANNVFSFLPANGASVTSFSGDINLFLKYLTANLGMSSSQYLKTAQAGCEATSGSATLTVSAYSMVIS